MSTAMQIIHASPYKEFPDTLIDLELCCTFAVLDGRKIGDALRACAKMKAWKVRNRNLQGSLLEMSKSMFPETQITRIRACIQKMEKHLDRAINGSDVDDAEINKLKEWVL